MMYMHSQCAKSMYGDLDRVPDDVIVHDACPDPYGIYYEIPYPVFKHYYILAHKKYDHALRMIKDLSTDNKELYEKYMRKIKDHE